MNSWLREFGMWTAGLLGAAVCACGFLTATVLLLSPRGRLAGMTAIEFVPISFLIIWTAGTLLAYRKSGSLQLALQLLAAGAVLSGILPSLFFLAVLVIYGMPRLG